MHPSSNFAVLKCVRACEWVLCMCPCSCVCSYIFKRLNLKTFALVSSTTTAPEKPVTQPKPNLTENQSPQRNHVDINVLCKNLLLFTHSAGKLKKKKKKMVLDMVKNYT